MQVFAAKVNQHDQVQALEVHGFCNVAPGYQAVSLKNVVAKNDYCSVCSGLASDKPGDGSTCGAALAQSPYRTARLIVTDNAMQRTNNTLVKGDRRGIAGAAMSLSSVSIIRNALLLRKTELSPDYRT